MDGTVGLSDPKSYLQQLQEIQDKIKQKTEDTDALKEEYIPEWKDMLRLDDGISKVFLLPEEKKFMDQDILNKIQELTHPLMLTDIHITSGVLDIVDELKERFETRYEIVFFHDKFMLHAIKC